MRRLLFTGALLLGGRMMPTTAADVGAGGSIFDVVARAAGGTSLLLGNL